jgi:hypothetical protein
MTELEDELSRELNVIADRAKPESIRPLRVPPPRRRSRTLRWLAPVAAAAAVAGLIAGVTVATRTAAPRPESPQTLGLRSMPKYYVTLSMPRQGHRRFLLAVVRASSNGATVGSARLPLAGASPVVDGMQAAASDRLFVASVSSLVSGANELYALRLAPDGRTDSFTQYPPSVENALKELDLNSGVLSPDGTKIAFERSVLAGSNCGVANSPCSQSVTIAVLSLTTGRLVQWTNHGVARPGSGVASLTGPLAWIDEQELVVNALRDGRWTYLVLNVSGHGGSVLADAKPITLAEPTAQAHWTMATIPILMPTGDAWVFTEFPAKPHVQPLGARVVETSTRTGRMAYSALVPDELQCGDPLSIAPTGFNFLISCMASTTTANGFGRVDGNRFTELPPDAAGILAAAW